MEKLESMSIGRSAAAGDGSGGIRAADAHVLGREAAQPAVVFVDPAAPEHRLSRTRQPRRRRPQPRPAGMEARGPPAAATHPQVDFFVNGFFIS